MNDCLWVDTCADFHGLAYDGCSDECPRRSTKYQVIYADPPWQYKDKGMHRGGAERHYRTTSMDDLCRLPIADISAEDSTCFMWVTMPMLEEGLRLLSAWGFRYKTMGFTWVKTNKNSGTPFWGMGHWTRANTELCLLGVRGKPKRVSPSVHSVVLAPVSRHSEKPDEVRSRIVQLMGDVPRLELFARTRTDGWDVWGDEA